MTSLDAILDQTVSKPYADKSVSRAQLADIWNVAMKSVEETLINRKACNFPNFGLFSLNISKVDLARPDAKSSITPTFLALPSFTQAAGIPAKKSPTQNALPVTQLNVTRIALESGVSRDQVDTSLRAVLRAAQEAVRAGSKLAVDVKIGTFVASPDGAAVKFNQRFQQLLQELEDAAKPAHLRTVTTLELVPDADAARALLEQQRQQQAALAATSTAPAASRSRGGSAGTAATGGRSSAPGSRGSLTGSYGATSASAVEPSSSRGASPAANGSGKQQQQQQQARTQRKPPQDEHDFHEDPDYCEVCQSRLAALQEKERGREQERSLEERLRQIALEKDAAEKKEAARQAELARRKRAEIDEFNKPLLHGKSAANGGGGVERPDQYGDLFDKRTEQRQIGHIDKDAYKAMLAEQMREKERRLKKEQEAEKQAAAEANRLAAEVHQREEQRQWEERRKANLEHKEFLKEQMTLKSDFVPAVLQAAETQFMGNRLVSTSELKQRQHSDAKQRANTQLETIQEKRALAERERLAAVAEGEAERIANQEALKRQKKEEELRKLQAQKEASAALLAQMAENKAKREEELQEARGSAAYFAVGEHGHDDHDKNCKKCGRTIKNTPPPNRQKSTLIPATRAY